MKWLIAPNAFKGTIESVEAAEIIKEVLHRFGEKETSLSPIADGGDGTALLLGKALLLPSVKVNTFDALGREKEAHYYFDKQNKTAYLDVSSATGIKHLNKNEINARKTSTYGTGIMIKKAVENGAKKIILGLGGSATVDMGLGILQALGFQYYNQQNELISPFSENLLFKIARIDAPAFLPDFDVACLCDVKNTFFGKEGAIPIFGPQKGIQKSEMLDFENAARKLFTLLKNHNSTLNDEEGFGAAGGIALGLNALLNTKLVNGFDFFAATISLEEQVKNCDLIITGEGKYEPQSQDGKGSHALLQMAQKHCKKCVLITSGNPGENTGFDDIIQLPDLEFNKGDFKQIAKENLRVKFEIWVQNFL